MNDNYIKLFKCVTFSGLFGAVCSLLPIPQDTAIIIVICGACCIGTLVHINKL